MKIAFVTPSLQLLDARWMWTRDPQIVKLGCPTVAGHLRGIGYESIRLYDFEVQLFALEKEEPGTIKLSVFFDDKRVDLFLADDEPEIRQQINLYLDRLEVEEADVFGLSCATVVDIYADLHAVGNLNMCLSKVLKERFPACRTVVGGLKGVLEPNQQDTEYAQMLDRCTYLDFTIQGAGEFPMENLIRHLEEGLSWERLNQPFTRQGSGVHLLPVAKHTHHIPRGIARQEGLLIQPKQEIREASTPDEAAEGDHERRQLNNPSVRVTPMFDAANIERRKLSGAEIIADYHLGAEWSERLSKVLDQRVAVLPYMFMEGCNASCTFCVYSTTKMVKQDIPATIRALAWMRETYGVRYFYFLNTNINGFYKYADVFCDELIAADLDILWCDCANLRALDQSLLEKMRRSGCTRLVYGMECPSDPVLKSIKKGITVDQAYSRLKEAHELGIWNHLLLITGLPHETPDDIARFKDFLEMTSEFTDGFSISSFYIESHSLMGLFPERYDLRLRPHPSGLNEQLAFDEIGGLPWEEKRKQIVWATDTITAKIQELKVDPKYTSGSIDLELLFWLYDGLGHDAKADIRRAYEEAYLVAPVHPKTYLPTMADLAHRQMHARDRQGPGQPWDLRTDLSTESWDMLKVPAHRGTQHVDLLVRTPRYYHRTESENVADELILAEGKSLTVSTPKPTELCTAVQDVLAPGSELAHFIEAEGWQIIEHATSSGPWRALFVLSGPVPRLELQAAILNEGDRCLLEKAGIGFSYRKAKDGSDPMGSYSAFIRQVGEHLLTGLREARDNGRLGVSSADIETLGALSTTLVQDIESQFSEQLKRDLDTPDQRVLDPGKRRGDRYSVAPTST